MSKVKLKLLMQDITRALIAHMKNEGYLDRVNTTQMFRDGALHYDRNKFIRQYNVYNDADDELDIFDTDLETLAVQLLQMVHYGRILYHNDNGKDIRVNNSITE
tara:strand:+ start:676 stop:987 length:312 start_codon:yes stop_codon:yes gene_type:complete